MSAYVTGAAISATSAALGYCVNALRERGARREAAKAARSTELHQALREYIAALDAVMLEVEDFPAPLRETALDRWVDSTLQGTPLDLAGHLFARGLKRLAYGRRHDDLSDRLVAAAARLRLVAPAQVEALMRQVEALAREHRAGGPQLIEHWRPLRERLRQGFKDALDGARRGAWRRLRRSWRSRWRTRGWWSPTRSSSPCASRTAAQGSPRTGGRCGDVGRP